MLNQKRPLIIKKLIGRTCDSVIEVKDLNKTPKGNEFHFQNMENKLISVKSLSCFNKINGAKV